MSLPEESRPGLSLRGVLLLTASILFATTAMAEKPRPAAAPSQAAAPGTETPVAAPKEPAAAETKGANKGAGVNVVETQETKEGVKTYKFGAVEVESRLKSPQLTYFLRRVRAEVSAGDLGHRSFLRELAETTRHPAFR
jgi:hypothetical protein